MNNRKRTATLTIRLTELEKATLRHKAARTKMSIKDFVASSALRTELDAAENIKPLLAELGRIGRLAAGNTYDALSSAKLQEMIDLQQGIYREVCRIARDA